MSTHTHSNTLSENTISNVLGFDSTCSSLLPAGIDEAYPLEAIRLEMLRRKLLNGLISEGYALCMPPLIEFLDTLVEDAGSDINLATFKLTDQLTGKMMGVRSDMTPQIARMDHQMTQLGATSLKSSNMSISRLCYIGSILKTRPDNFGGTRSPIQLGAEIYGSYSAETDLEVILLMINTLIRTGIDEEITLDIGHLDVFNSLLKKHNLALLFQNSPQNYNALFDAIAKKAPHNLPCFLSEPARQDFLKLLELSGEIDVITQAKHYFPDISAIDEVILLCQQIKSFHPDVNIHVDFTELRGHRYYTGLIFGAFISKESSNISGQAIALGGRYDDIGKRFKQKRPAVGFSTDLRKLLNLIEWPDDQQKIILAPAICYFDAELERMIAKYRAADCIVIRDLQADLTHMTPTHKLVFDAHLEEWILI